MPGFGDWLNSIMQALPANERSSNPTANGHVTPKVQQKSTGGTSGSSTGQKKATTVEDWIKEKESGNSSQQQQETPKTEQTYQTTQIRTEAPQGQTGFADAIAKLFQPEIAYAAESEESKSPEAATTQDQEKPDPKNPNSWKRDAQGRVITPQTSEAYEKINGEDADGANIEQVAPGIYFNLDKINEKYGEKQGPEIKSEKSQLYDPDNWVGDGYGGYFIPPELTRDPNQTDMDDVQKMQDNLNGENSDGGTVTDRDGNVYDLTTAEGKYEKAMQMIEDDGTDSFIKQFAGAVDEGTIKRADGSVIKMADFDKGNGQGNERYAQFFVDTALPDYCALLTDPNFIYYYDKTWYDMGFDLFRSGDKGIDGALALASNPDKFAELYKTTDEYNQTVMDNFTGKQMSGLGGDYETQQAMIGLLGDDMAQQLIDNGSISPAVLKALNDEAGKNKNFDMNGAMSGLLSSMANNAEMDYLNNSNKQYERGAATAAKRFNESQSGMGGEAYQASADAKIGDKEGQTLKQTGHTEATRNALVNAKDWGTYNVSRAGNMKALSNTIDDDDEIYWYQGGE